MPQVTAHSHCSNFSLSEVTFFLNCSLLAMWTHYFICLILTKKRRKKIRYKEKIFLRMVKGLLVVTQMNQSRNKVFSQVKPKIISSSQNYLRKTSSSASVLNYWTSPSVWTVGHLPDTSWRSWNRSCLNAALKCGYVNSSIRTTKQDWHDLMYAVIKWDILWANLSYICYWRFWNWLLI